MTWDFGVGLVGVERKLRRWGKGRAYEISACVGEVSTCCRTVRKYVVRT